MGCSARLPYLACLFAKSKVFYGAEFKKRPTATLEAKYNKNINASVPVIGPGTNDHHTKC